MAVMVRSCYPTNPLKNNNKRQHNQIQAGLKSRIPIMQNKNPPMLVALRKPTVSELTSLKDSTSVNTAQFSIRRVERVNSKGKRVDRRQHSDAFEERRHEEARRAMKELTSLSVENTGNVLFCVRDSKELHHAKLASSTSHNHIVEKSIDQAEMLYREIQHPKAFKHPSPLGTKQVLPTNEPKKNKTYSEMYLARQHVLDKEERETQRRRQESLISKQQTHFRGRVSLSPEVKQSSFPHTLPSALYGPPRNLADYSALYSASPLPPIHDAAHNNVQNNLPSVVPEVIPGFEQTASKPAQQAQEVFSKEGYSAPKRKITYKPYTLKDTLVAPAKVGGLGPDTETTDYKLKAGLKSRIPIMHNKNPPMLVALRKPTVSEVTSLKDSTSENTALFSIRRVERVNTKGICVDRRLLNDVFELEKANRQIEYANRIRNDHKKREFPKRASSHVTCPPLPSKATIAKQYAKTLPLPKPGKPKWDHQLKPLPNVTPTKESTILQEEVLRQRLKTHMEHKRILEELHKL